MSTEPEVHFCNVCNQSIPETALESGAAVRVEGRIVPVATPEAAVTRHPAAPARSALVVAGLVVVAAVAASAIYLDWRMTESESRVRDEVASMSGSLGRSSDRLDALDRRLATTSSVADLVPLQDAVGDARELIRSDVRELQGLLVAAAAREAELKDSLKELEAALVQQTARFTLLQDELGAVARDVSDLLARPAAAPVEARRTDVPTPPSGEPEAAGGLPAELAHHVMRLSDADDGTRFEAVDQLLMSKDERIYPHLLPLAKDPDLFVRRLVLEGLSEYRSPESVEAMLTALADPEEVVRHTAYLGLKRLTGEDIAFDAGASADQRGAMQRRWRQWWERNRDSF